jgi:hypothetical protein
MAMDETLQVHELSSAALRAALGISAGPLHQAWVVPAMGFLAVFGAMYLRFVFALPARSRNLFVLAGAVYVAGALGMEMAGMVIFLYALLDHLGRSAPESRLRIVS